MKTFANQSQTNLLGKRVAFMKQLITANCGNKVRVNTRCCLHLRVSTVVNVGRMSAGPHNVQSNASFNFLSSSNWLIQQSPEYCCCFIFSWKLERPQSICGSFRRFIYIRLPVTSLFECKELQRCVCSVIFFITKDYKASQTH